ncbi:hypothetical protein Hanom_Chr05g00431051 [Helianthus anomalus]
MDKRECATCTTTPIMAEETKRIFPLVGQLARYHSWHSCSSLLHPPAINRTLRHSRLITFCSPHSLHTHTAYFSQEQYLFSRRSLVKRETPISPS